MNTIYVHYGSDKFDYNKMKYYMDMCKNYTKCNLKDLFEKDFDDEFVRLMTSIHSKPIGLWASRKETNFGWKEWSEMEEFNTSSLEKTFEFKLKNETKNSYY